MTDLTWCQKWDPSRQEQYHPVTVFPSSHQYCSNLTHQTSGGSSNTRECQDCWRRGRASGLYYTYSTVWDKRQRKCSPLLTPQPRAGSSMMMSWASLTTSSKSERTSFKRVHNLFRGHSGWTRPRSSTSLRYTASLDTVSSAVQRTL